MNREELKEKYGKKRVQHEWRKTDKLTALIVTFFGSGMSPKAPGTMGSLAAAIVAYPMALVILLLSDPSWSRTTEWSIPCFSFYWDGFFIEPFFINAALFVFFAALPFVDKAMKDTGSEDPGWIVIDEVCGVFTALAFVPSVVIVDCPWVLLFGFGLFRFFDIFKPFGIHQIEKLRGAWGVMADDFLGGLYTGILMGLGLTAYLSIF